MTILGYIILFVFCCVMLIIYGFRQYKKGYEKGYEDGYKRQEYDFAKWMF